MVLLYVVTFTQIPCTPLDANPGIGTYVIYNGPSKTTAGQSILDKKMKLVIEDMTAMPNDYSKYRSSDGVMDLAAISRNLEKLFDVVSTPISGPEKYMWFHIHETEVNI